MTAHKNTSDIFFIKLQKFTKNFYGSERDYEEQKSIIAEEIIWDIRLQNTLQS